MLDAEQQLAEHQAAKPGEYVSAYQSRIDSLLAQPGYVSRQLEADKQLLLFPSGGMAAQSIGRDPLGLFTPVVERLRQSADNITYELYDGYVFSPDMQRAVVTLDSPFGSSETENNGQLLALLHESKCPNLCMRIRSKALHSRPPDGSVL